MEKKKLALFFSLLGIACIFLAAAVIIAFNMPQEIPVAPIVPPQETSAVIPSAAAQPTAPSQTQETETLKSEATEPVTETTKEKSSESAAKPASTEAPSVSAPDELVTLLSQNGSTVDVLNAAGCSQLVTVSSSGSSAEIGFYEKENGKWVKDSDMTCSGFVGWNGTTYDMHEGGNATPRGLFRVGDAFYQEDRPSTGLNSFAITSDTYWVDDPASKYYNQKVVGTDNKDWDSAEKMWEHATYLYGFVIEYNTVGTVPGAGSAIFFHTSSGQPTAGCVSTDTANVLRYLSRLDASQNPYIIIV